MFYAVRLRLPCSAYNRGWQADLIICKGLNLRGLAAKVTEETCTLKICGQLFDCAVAFAFQTGHVLCHKFFAPIPCKLFCAWHWPFPLERRVWALIE